MKRTHLRLVVVAVLAGVLAVWISRESSPREHLQPKGAAVQPVLPQPSNPPPAAYVEVYPTTPPPPPPVVLPNRQPGRTLNPTREQVQAIMARMRRGPEQEPEFEKLNASLIALDYRDYPEEFAEMVGGPGYFFYVWDGLKRQFHANDDPIFLQAVLDYFHRELPRLSPPARYFHFIEFFAHMTNSPALVPPLIKGLESPDYRAAIASAASLAALPTTESARALLQAVKTAPYSDDLEINTRGTIALCIGRMRNAELIPMFEAELAVTKDELLRAQLKHAIAQSKR